MSYICISHAAKDRAVVEKFCRELTAYGFRYMCMDETVDDIERYRRMSEGTALVVLTSPAADDAGHCASDILSACELTFPCLCVSLSPNRLDERFGPAGNEASISPIPYPGGETDTPDERSVALFVHRFYIGKLCQWEGCFSPADCEDNAYGRMIRHAFLAWQGSAEDQYALGCAYMDGNGVPVLETEAAHWMRQAADGGLTSALVRMGELYLDGAGIERNPVEALRLFSAAARQGSAAGQYYKGICCLYGYGLMKDPEMAVRYLRVAAGMGYAPALYRLGLLYRDGIGAQQNWRMAVKHLYLAACEARDKALYGTRLAPANQGAEDGMKKGAAGATVAHRKYVCVSMRFMRQKKLTALRGTQEKFALTPCRSRRASYPEDGWLYDLDETYDSSRYNRTRGYSRQRWDLALAEGALGRMLELGDPATGIAPAPVAAFVWYRRAMKHGHSGAMFRLGDAYRSGRGVPADAAQAVKLFRRAAEFGNERGQFAMGVCCERGQGTPVDSAAAVRWYEASAQAGYAPAQNNLGGCYEYGIGVQINLPAAVEWYTRASAQGQSEAACRLGLCYENGRGVPRSEERAFHLYEDAARRGHSYALYRLGLCYDRGLTVSSQVAYAAHLYERAARGGVGEAAYAMALCCRSGRGVRKNQQESLDWLVASAELGCVQGCFALGLCYFEGNTAVQNRHAAEIYFKRAATLYRSMSERTREDMDRVIPVDSVTCAEAAGGALYMLGYGALCHNAEPDVDGALAYFKEAAAFDRHEAMTAVGDLYAFGLIDMGSPEENKRAAIAAYEEAAKGNQPDALLSLATYYEREAKACLAKEDAHGAQVWRERGWRSLARSAEQGSAYALVGMASYAWFGYGTAENRETARWFLDRADTWNARHDIRAVRKETAVTNATADNGAPEVQGNTLASLWLGDMQWMELAACEQPVGRLSAEASMHLAAARKAYLRAIAAPYMPSESGAYMLPSRREMRMNMENKAKAEAHYRLAILGMLYGKDNDGKQEAFAHLGAAVLAGHERALDDLARMYVGFKQSHGKEIREPEKRKRRKSALKDERVPSLRQAGIPVFGEGYYDAASPVPEPFSTALPDPEKSGYVPAHMTTVVTDTMRANALNYLGDRYFYGEGVDEAPAMAVASYRRAAAVVQPRGEAISGGIVWAQYSLGWCLLNGVGTKKNPTEAVLWLTRAAKYHGNAAFSLAQCHEAGIGVDTDDLLEALKYYRRALKLGYAAAEPHISALEEKLKGEA